MDSHNENSKDGPSTPKQTPSSDRLRTPSESSAASEDGGGPSISEKRQRTTSAQFMVATGMTAASPPKFVSLDEIMQAANAMRDMALVHHIAVDENFKLERVEPKDTIHKVIKETMHKAFWDLLREQLKEDPPCFKQAFILLENIKDGLMGLLLPQHAKLKQQISEVLDIELIKQQAEQGTLDFQHYAQYIISIMAKMCAPVRDDKIKELTEVTDVVDCFRGILETLDLMQLDMANYTLQVSKPEIIANSVELERRKFADFLAIQYDGLQHTKKWLSRHLDATQTVPPNTSYETFVRTVVKKTFSEACLDLLDWKSNEPYPETFMLDEERLERLQIETKRLIAVGTILLVTLSSVGPDLQSVGVFKEALKEHIVILLQDVQSNDQLQKILPNVAEQVVNDVKEAQERYSVKVLTDVSEKLLKEQIVDVARPDHRIKQLVEQRIKEFLLEIIESSPATSHKVPTGLSALQKSLTEIAGQFFRIVSHNNTVFCVYYFDIVAAALPKPA